MEDGRIVAALAGNPNVGKSSIFNALTKMHQHTGNWTGKTVALAQGTYQYGGKEFLLVDLPGTYSLNARSEEEKLPGIISVPARLIFFLWSATLPVWSGGFICCPRLPVWKM